MRMKLNRLEVLLLGALLCHLVRGQVVSRRSPRQALEVEDDGSGDYYDDEDDYEDMVGTTEESPTFQESDAPSRVVPSAQVPPVTFGGDSTENGSGSRGSSKSTRGPSPTQGSSKKPDSIYVSF